MLYYEWPDGSTVEASEYCPELDKWRGDDFDSLLLPDEGSPVPREQLDNYMSWIFGH